MNLTALVLSQFVALPAPLTIPPGEPLLIRADVVPGSVAELNGKVVIAFTSDERAAATRKPAPTGDLWLATWDGVAVTSRLLCQGTGQGFTGAVLAATADRVLVVMQGATEVRMVLLDSSLRPITPPCGDPLTSEPVVGISVTAVDDSFLVLTQGASTLLVGARWVTSSGGVLGPSYVSSAVRPAAPVGLAVDGGALITFRQTAPGDLMFFQAGPMGGSAPSSAPGSAAYGTFKTTLAESGPLLVGWSRTLNGWELISSELRTGSRLPPLNRTWMVGSMTAAPPTPLVVATDAGVAVISWLAGGTPETQLSVIRTPPVSSFQLGTGSTPVGATPGTLVTREAPAAFALRGLSVGAGQLGSVQGFVNARPSHQQSVNVVWTTLGWLVVWEEPGTQLSGIASRSTVRAILTNGQNIASLAVQGVPGRRPTVRRRPNGQLLASFDLTDGGSTIVPLTLTSSMLSVGVTPVVPDIGALSGFEVSPTELFRWQPSAMGTAVYRGAAVVGVVSSASSRGAFAEDTFWLPARAGPQAVGFGIPTGVTTAPISMTPVEGEIAVGAAPQASPTELLYAWNDPDAGLMAVLQTAPPMFDSSYSAFTARFLGGRPVRLDDRWLLGLRPSSGGVVIQSWDPMLGSRVLRVGTERGEIVEFVAAEAPDGGAAAFAWTTWENDGLDAGLRLSLQLVTVSSDAGVPDAGAGDGGAGPDGGSNTDAGTQDAGTTTDAGSSGDGGSVADAGSNIDGGTGADAGVTAGDGGTAVDGGAEDAGVVDGGADGGASMVVFAPTSCGCGASGGGPLLTLLLLASFAWRRRRTAGA
ncbi:MAG: hypothetical protein JNJ54_18415 [Myxococcaceae bacterium]|nr:hypothetical protein [Myxococcaceae bacterium]